MKAIAILCFSATLDYLLGDPWGWPHPVRAMGWFISHYTSLIFRWQKAVEPEPTTPQSAVLCTVHRQQWRQHLSRLGLRLAGVVLTLLLVGGSGLVGWLIVKAMQDLHPIAGLLTQVVLLASCFAGRSLRSAAEDVLRPLGSEDLAQARSRLAMYVGRETENLSPPEILRAVFETVTENATDGVMAPLFYAAIGLLLPGVGSVPLALAYKAASTLDSTVGYREAPYTDLGWFPAKFEDVLTWLPCRCTVLTLSLISGRPGRVWLLCWRDAPKDASPNSGWSECAYAAALNVQVGGVNWYRGVAKSKPLLGEALEPISPTKIYQALRLTRLAFMLWILIVCLAMAIATRT
jgi:adenosylcobinamide-phosphate synthase